MAGVVVVNAEGIPIKTTMDNTTTVQYAGLISQLSDKVSFLCIIFISVLLYFCLMLRKGKA